MQSRMKPVVAAFIILLACMGCVGNQATKPEKRVQRKHKCPMASALQARTIKEMGEIKQPALLEQSPLFSTGDSLGFSVPVIWRFEILISEEGKVECAEYIGASGVDQLLMQKAIASLKTWTYQVPRDSAGKAVAVYWVINVEISQTR